MKTKLLLGIALVSILSFGTCGLSGIRVYKRLVHGEKLFGKWDIKIVKWCGGSLPFVQQIDKLFDGKYIVLLQNNYELRPSGGFMGSYAVVDFKKGLNVLVKDIYDADGKLPGHVEPPYPIQEAFLQGWWKLRDSNWKIEFSSAALDINWFLEQGGETKIDGIIAVNMELFKKWLEVLGGVEAITYDQVVTGKNLYMLAQREAEENFVPGSTQKRDFLGAVGAALLERSKGAGLMETVKLVKLLRGELSNRQILMWFKDQELSKEVEKWGWGGDLPKLPVGVGYIYVVEANLGANKANCCIEREIAVSEMGIKIKWKNENVFSEKKPPIFWGGDYYDYLRVIVNKPMINDQPSIKVDGKELRRATEKDFEIPNSLRKGVSWDMYHIEEYKAFYVIGFWVMTEAKKEGVAEIFWNWQGNSLQKLRGIMVDRQPGIDGFGLRVDWDNKIIYDGRLANREVIWLN